MDFTYLPAAGPNILPIVSGSISSNECRKKGTAQPQRSQSAFGPRIHFSLRFPLTSQEAMREEARQLSVTFRQFSDRIKSSVRVVSSTSFGYFALIARIRSMTR